MDEDEFGKDNKNPFDIVDLKVASKVTGQVKGSADLESNPFDNPFADESAGDEFGLDIPEVRASHVCIAGSVDGPLRVPVAWCRCIQLELPMLPLSLAVRLHPPPTRPADPRLATTTSKTAWRKPTQACAMTPPSLCPSRCPRRRCKHEPSSPPTCRWPPLPLRRRHKQQQLLLLLQPKPVAPPMPPPMPPPPLQPKEQQQAQQQPQQQQQLPPQQKQREPPLLRLHQPQRPRL
jgi:hypothetical protein